MFWNRNELTEQALHAYVTRVATGLGLGPESWFCEFTDVRAAYLALAGRLPEAPDRDAALVWDDRLGWSVAIETGSAEDLLVLAWFGADPLPAPEDVVAFVKHLLNGQPAGQPTPPTPVRDVPVSQGLGAYLDSPVRAPASAPDRAAQAADQESVESDPAPAGPVPDRRVPVVRTAADLP